MKATLMLAIAVGLGVPREDDAVKKELAKLQGEWVVAGAEKGGKKLSEDERRKLSKFFLTKVVVTDDKWNCWISEDNAEPKEGMPQDLTLDPSKSPKRMMFGPNPAIYQVEGDTLKVCCDGNFSKEESDIPTAFDTSKNENWYCYILKKKK
jgi:uncharacterized protein (TIGR03067 family)